MGSEEQRRRDPLWPAWAAEPVVLVDADPAWATLGELERDHLEALLRPWLIGSIDHIGSTAVPGLPAKPIIDLQALVSDLRNPGPMAAALAPLGWHYVDPDLDQRPWRRFFVKIVDGRRGAHLHVMTPDCARWHQQLAFRDALRADPHMTSEYATLKRILADRYTDDREAYTAAKAAFIRTVLGLA